MNRQQFTDFVKAVFNDDILKLNEEKGNDYAGTADVFRNFSSNGERLGLHPYQVWAVYFSKHIDAIITFTKDGSVKSEPVEGRIDDAIMYLLLLRGMLASEKQAALSESVESASTTRTDTPKHGADALKVAGDRPTLDQLIGENKDHGGPVTVTYTEAPQCTCPPWNTAHSAVCPMSIYTERVKRERARDLQQDGETHEFKPSPQPRK